jgi:GNAT superfamily N-acetyltransferase
MKPGDVVDVTVTYLEMLESPREPVPPAPPGVEVRTLVSIPAAVYRRLYGTVGRDWHWVDRHALSDAELEAQVNDPGIEIDVLEVDGAEAGYAELDRRTAGEIRLVYFGLAPAFIGRGLGSWFLRWTVERAWSWRPRRVHLDTCTLDHPRALGNYEAVGFRRYDARVRSVTIQQPVGGSSARA